MRCVAVPLRGAPTLTAISVSGPSGRMTRETVPDVVPIMRDAADRFAKELGPTA
ncbi:IclR family transcriptional regulator domain-containing protein [Actinomadura madurae]|uniref:IclR family transcriptional regulator domain-containing protein n=1 Tax=Actinomadura madurae TaxID=1993 RepID=UPI003FD8CFF4